MTIRTLAIRIIILGVIIIICIFSFHYSGIVSKEELVHLRCTVKKPAPSIQPDNKKHFILMEFHEYPGKPFRAYFASRMYDFVSHVKVEDTVFIDILKPNADLYLNHKDTQPNLDKPISFEIEHDYIKIFGINLNGVQYASYTDNNDYHKNCIIIYCMAVIVAGFIFIVALLRFSK